MKPVSRGGTLTMQRWPHSNLSIRCFEIKGTVSGIRLNGRGKRDLSRGRGLSPRRGRGQGARGADSDDGGDEREI